MIATLMLIPGIGWSFWVMYRAVRSTHVKMPVASESHAGAVLGLEDDPAQWLAACGSWTEMDERQLIRLLTDSAP